jgi:hypothetical protein
MLGIRGGDAVGWHRAGPSDGPQFSSRRFAIPDDSLLDRVLRSPSPLIGRPELTDGNAAFMGWLGRRRPRTALVIPVIVARRTVGALWADSGVRPRELDTLSDLVAFGVRLGPAFEMLLRARHSENAELFKRDALDDEPPAPPPVESLGGDTDNLVPRPLPIPPRLQPVSELDDHAADVPAPPAFDNAMAEDAIGDADVPAPPTLDDVGASADDVPAPPALDDPPAAAPDGEKEDKRDGTSPFARNYVAPAPKLPEPPTMAPSLTMEGDGTWNLVIEGGAASLDSGMSALLAEPTTTGRDDVPAPPPFDDDEPTAPPPPELGETDEEPPAPTGTEIPRPPTMELDLPSDVDALIDHDGDTGESDGETPAVVAWADGGDDEEEDIVVDAIMAHEAGLPKGPVPSALAPATPAPSTEGEPVDDSDAIGRVDDGDDAPSASEGPDVALGSFLSDVERAENATVDFLTEADGTPVVDESASADHALSLPPDVSVDLVHSTGAAARAESTDVPDPEGDQSDTGAWRGALVDTVSRGHQGGEAGAHEPVLAGEDGWEDVVLDSAYTASLNKRTTPSAAAPSAPPPPPPPADEEPEPVDTDDGDDGPTADTRADVPASPPAAGPPPDVKDLVEMLESLKLERIDEAKAGLIALGERALPALTERFPGRLLVDPFARDTNVETAADLGPMIEVLEQIGAPSLKVALAHLDSRFPAHRYAATFLFLLVPADSAIRLLRPRLHDHEPKIRTLAAAALSQFMAHPDFEGQVLHHLRERLTSPAVEARVRAIQLLGNFRDVGAVPALIPVVEEKNQAVAEVAREALGQITLQDFAYKGRAWKKWWEKARKRSRIEWLIDGLRSKERNIRFLASAELLAITEQDFGYHCDQPKREREQGAHRYEAWWDEQRRAMNA